MNDDIPNEFTITVPVPDDVQEDAREVIEENPDINPEDYLTDAFSWDWDTHTGQ